MLRRALTAHHSGRVSWAGAALEEALREALRAFPLETGGLLLGWSPHPGCGGSPGFKLKVTPLLTVP